ncbi:unnamed protein product [Peniophora sp. CBMAI 1063]|nr:unnamed protein product [Peniophora sp. CBMAI 1063]
MGRMYQILYDNTARRRVAALALPALLDRARNTLDAFAADARVRRSRGTSRSFLVLLSVDCVSGLGVHAVGRDALAGVDVFHCGYLVREEELLYVLEKILALKLWPSSFASSAASRGGKGDDASPTAISSAISASTRAHLFALYTPLVEIAAHQRPPPACWARAERVLSSPSIATPPATPTRSRTRVGRDSDDEGEIVRRGARELARECLRAVGGEMGVPA